MILVLGAGGFIGTYLVNRLIEQGQEVIASDINDIAADYYRRRGTRYQTVDITKPFQFETELTKKIRAVVHLACVQPANVSEKKYSALDFARVNILGTLNVLEFCRTHAIRKIVYTASHRNTQGMWVEKSGRAISEGDGRSIKFTGDYAMFSISESAATDCVEHYSKVYGIDGVTLRLPPVYGYGPHTEIFREGKPIKTGFQIFIDSAKQGRPLVLWGDSTQGRDIVYVKDVVSAIMLALEKPDIAGLYNIASGHRLSLKEQAEAIVRVFSPPDAKSPIVSQPEKANDIESYVYDIGKARRVLGWEPKYSFEAMLLDYQQEQLSGKFDFLVEKRRALMREAAAS